MHTPPAFRSLAFDDLPQPDYADMVIATLPPGASVCPRHWAETLFSLRQMPLWVRVALVVRQAVVPLVGIPVAPRDVFRVRHVEGDEALISVNDKHLDFRCAVGVDQTTRLVRVTTTVKLKGWRGRLYFAPVRLAHPLVVSSMVKRSQKVLRASIQFF